MSRSMWVVFIFYVLVLGFASMHHRLWGDEVHTWNIAKGSGSFSDLIANRRYEGHPPAWHTILWAISKCTHRVVYMQVAQWIITCGVIWLVLFYAPFARSTRALLPFGYYFLFEYGVLSRNYALGVLFAFAICVIIRKDFRYKTVVYYILLFCLSNVHLLGLLLAVSLHAYWLLLERGREKGPTRRSIFLLWGHALAGLLILLPAVYFILPPADSEMNVHALLQWWNIRQLTTGYEVPLRAFMPLPAFWQYHFWNTQCLIALKNDHSIFKWINPVITLALLSWAFLILRRNKKSTLLFALNLVLSLMVSMTFYSLTTARYTGFVFIGFIVAYWLLADEKPITKNNISWVNLLLGIQTVGGIFALYMDLRFPFSNTYQVQALIDEVPPGKNWVTDYWTMNAVVAYTDHPAYCIDMQKNMSFVLWGPDMAALHKMPDRYTNGLRHYFQNKGPGSVYMISQSPLPILKQTDPLLTTSYRVTLVDQREGAIEKGSNLYLYQIGGL